MRYDYFLIWGNGIQYKWDILDYLRDQTDLEIIRIQDFKTRNIKKFVEAVYSYDYAPFHHLKNKTRYLLRKQPEAVFIFVKNKNPQERIFGVGTFQHIECENIKRIKEEIRNKFNPRINGKRTEEHVIHASDNQEQTDNILKYLGFQNGLIYLSREPNKIITTKYYIEPFLNFRIKKIDIERLYCNILKGNKENYSNIRVTLDKTPHFKCLKGNINIYKEYIENFLGGPLTDDYSINRYISLSKDLQYLDTQHSTEYILVKKIDSDSYLILDGLHRAVTLKYQGRKEVIAAIIGS